MSVGKKMCIARNQFHFWAMTALAIVLIPTSVYASAQSDADDEKTARTAAWNDMITSASAMESVKTAVVAYNLTVWNRFDDGDVGGDDDDCRVLLGATKEAQVLAHLQTAGSKTSQGDSERDLYLTDKGHSVTNDTSAQMSYDVGVMTMSDPDFVAADNAWYTSKGFAISAETKSDEASTKYSEADDALDNADALMGGVGCAG